MDYPTHLAQTAVSAVKDSRGEGEIQPFSLQKQLIAYLPAACN
jgi:hypothetical protein